MPPESNSPFARTISRAAAFGEKLDTPLWRLLGSWVRWVILAAVAVGVWAGRAWLSQAIATDPSVVRAQTAVVEAREAATMAARKADTANTNQERIADILSTSLAEQKAMRQTLTSMAQSVAVIGSKVDDAAKQNAQDVRRIDERLNVIQAQRK